MPDPVTAAEQRRTKRRAAVRVLHCPISGLPGKPDLPAIVFDLSANGIGLMVSPQVKSGQKVAVRLTEAGTGRPALELPARVVSAGALNPGWFFLGAEFFDAPLAQELSAEMFDVLFCDLFMPGMGGLQVIREVRRAFPAVKIVAVSGGGGRGNVEHLHAARMLGAEAAIHKPYGPKALFQAMEQVLPSFADVGPCTLYTVCGQE